MGKAQYESSVSCREKGGHTSPGKLFYINAYVLLKNDEDDFLKKLYIIILYIFFETKTSNFKWKFKLDGENSW